MSWLDPADKRIGSSSNDARIRALDSGHLLIDHVQPRDSGKYTCHARNQLGRAVRTALVEVYSSDIHLVLKAKTSSFISLTWNCTESTVSTIEYVIIYRKSEPDIRYRRIPLRPHMRAYTFSKLRPQTLYEFCVGYINTRQQPEPVNCLKVRTKYRTHIISGHKGKAGVRIMISVTVTSLVITLLCVLSAACRSRKRRKYYEEPNSYGGISRTRKTKSLESFRITQIPLNDLYTTPTSSSPSTPLYASTQSLIPGSKV